MEKKNAQRRIFISYRRKGGVDTARLIHDQLKSRGYQVFIDMEGLRAGAFNQALYHEIKNSDVFLIVLTPGCLDRCRHTEDWVRRELAYALQCGLNIVPVMKEDFLFPPKLPNDIAPIRSYQAVRISYDLFDAFMDKLEEYICADAQTPVVYEPDPFPTFWTFKNIIIILLAVILLLVGAYLLPGMFGAGEEPPAPPSAAATQSAAPETEPTTVPTTAPATEPTTEPITEPASEPTIEVPVLSGNSVTNLCNGAIIALTPNNEAVWTTSKNVQWFNKLATDTDLSYFYNPEQHKIIVQWPEDDKTLSVTLLKDVNCRYLYVTSEWLYCVLEENGVETLYRAENHPDTHRIGQLQPVVENVLSHNKIAICDDYIYYWIRAEGLFRCRTDGSSSELLFNNGGSKNLFGLLTFHISEDAVYFLASTGGIYSVSITGGSVRHILDTRGLPGVPTHAVEFDGDIYYVMEYRSGDVSTEPAEIWCVKTDGTQNQLLTTLESTDMNILNLNISSALFLKISNGETESMYRFPINGQKLELLGVLHE